MVVRKHNDANEPRSLYLGKVFRLTPNPLHIYRIKTDGVTVPTAPTHFYVDIPFIRNNYRHLRRFVAMFLPQI